MNGWIAAFHFLRPWWLLLALAWLALVILALRAERYGGRLRRLADAALLPHLVVRSGRSRHASSWLLAVVGALVTLALAGPAWQRLPQPLYGADAAQVVVVSLSQRMLAKDVSPNRIQRMRYKVRDLLNANAEGRNGLVAYAGAAFVVAPLTTDAHALDDLVAALAPDVMPVPGDAPAKGIRQGMKLLRQASAPHGSLVLVTDRVNAAAIAAARKARAAGARVSVLGVGGDHGVPVKLAGGALLKNASGRIVLARQQPATLRALAAAGGGVYTSMRADNGDIAALKGELRAGHGVPAHARLHADQWRDMGPWLLLPVVLLVAMSFRRGWLLVLVLGLTPLVAAPVSAAETVPATASSVAQSAAPPDAPGTSWRARWSALWHNADQRVAQALAAGNIKDARKLARAPAMRGAAAYRAGDYAHAAADFAQAPGADAAYNLGNALARAGHYRRAIAAYDKALREDPDLADARANRKAVTDWMRRHRQQQSSPGTRRQGPSRPSSAPSSGSGAKRQPSAGKRAHSGPGKAASASTPQAASGASAGHSPRASPAHAGTAANTRRRQHSDSRHQGEKDRKAQIRAAREALKKRLGARQPNPSQGFDLGDAPAPARSVQPLPQPMQRALDRVPDDPGGLLRRKFQLEYQQRHGGGR